MTDATLESLQAYNEALERKVSHQDEIIADLKDQIEGDGKRQQIKAWAIDRAIETLKLDRSEQNISFNHVKEFAEQFTDYCFSPTLPKEAA